ncbi:hypothetical protein AMJ44_09050 [candidate division WOR-1 bacterium DG_54_3]|uniref:Carboxypeptidase regulatory-like domain-containing protein n=1 Tax=candidate division WOR-1 bacterium DG_54_3 TaxID=1703775 RepID=A0A0S7XUA6_UNCSA|nr:MAG: hypothetical protein AMJ44_09050 [candidate division WOR-1 bacterium DG_54_3]
MRHRILGIVREKESGKPLSGLLVCAYDKDLFRSDLLGKNLTGPDGKFTIEYESKDYQELIDRNPDVYLKIYRDTDAKDMEKKRVKPIFTTKEAIRYSASSSEKFYIEIPREKLG